MLDILKGVQRVFNVVEDYKSHIDTLTIIVICLMVVGLIFSWALKNALPAMISVALSTVITVVGIVVMANNIKIIKPILDGREAVLVEYMNENSTDIKVRKEDFDPKRVNEEGDSIVELEEGFIYIPTGFKSGDSDVELKTYVFKQKEVEIIVELGLENLVAQQSSLSDN